MSPNAFPLTQLIKLESTEIQWRMLTNGLVTELNFKANVERIPGKIATINLKITTIIPPEAQNHSTKVKVISQLTEEHKNGLERIESHFSNFYQKKMWLMFGTIQGEKPKTIMIVYYEIFNIAVYTIKPNEEKLEKFMPEGMSLN
jgi:hypothetical protein